MEARNIADLEKQLMKHLNKAMTVASTKMEADVYEEVGKFYNSPTPKKYVRTGTLANTPRVTPLSKIGKSISYDVYLDSSGNYDTGDNPTVLQVLKLANYGGPWVTASGAEARPTIGKGGFWERSEKKMTKTLKNTMRKFFS